MFQRTVWYRDAPKHNVDWWIQLKTPTEKQLTQFLVVPVSGILSKQFDANVFPFEEKVLEMWMDSSCILLNCRGWFVSFLTLSPQMSL